MTDNVIRLDMHNVTKACLACGGPVVTDHKRIPVCIKCREKGLCATDDLNETCNNLTTARAAADAYYTELKDLGTFNCPACMTRITPDEQLHSSGCSIAETLALPMETDE